jgi:enamine deaminase RidA (YjgF/YER057c/UK114 family)
VAGQTGTDSEGKVVEGGLAGQAEQALLNVFAALESAGAGPADVAKLNMYVVDWDPSMAPALFEGAAKAGSKYELTAPATTLVGVKSLFEPGMLIEIEAIAVVD